MQSNSEKDELNVPRMWFPSSGTRRRFHVGCIVPVMLLLIVLFTYEVNSSRAYAASREIVISGCTHSANASQTPALILLPNPSFSPSPPSTPTQENVEKRIWQYITLVFDGDCQDAYSILSLDQRAEEHYNVFIGDKEYTLLPGCWMIGRELISSVDNLTWVISIDIRQVACDTRSPIIFYSWNFSMQMQSGQLQISSISLNGVGVGNG
jgi:hypothetical protein